MEEIVLEELDRLERERLEIERREAALAVESTAVLTRTDNSQPKVEADFGDVALDEPTGVVLGQPMEFDLDEPLDEPASEETSDPLDEPPHLNPEPSSGSPEPSNEELGSGDDSGASKTGSRGFFARHKQAFIVGAIVVAVILLGCGAFFAHMAMQERAEQERQAAAEEEAREQALNTPHKVKVEIVIPDFDEEHASPIPLRVTGETLSNQKVSEVRLVKPSDSQLSLLPGTYKVALAGNPATEDGYLYAGSSDSFEVVVSEKDDGKEPKVPKFAFSRIEPQNVRDEEIDALRFWMETAGVKGAQTYIDAVTSLRQQTLERLEQEQREREEEERRQAEEEAQRQAEAQRQYSQSQTYANNYNSYYDNYDYGTDYDATYNSNTFSDYAGADTGAYADNQ